MILKCKICGKDFEKTAHRKTYCNRKCYLKDAKNVSLRGKDCHNFINEIPAFKINDEITAYFLGFLQTDGTLDHKRVSIEIGTKDISILYAFEKKFGGKVTTRIRNTNFSNNHSCSCWRLGSVAFVKQMNALGIPCGKKSNIISPIEMPKEFERHYIRGLIDGDGSLSITSTGRPCLGFVTDSDKMKKYISKWLLKHGNVLTNVNRNKRDNIYSITVTGNKAQKLIEILYQDCSVYLPRKLEIAQRIMTRLKEPMIVS